MKNYTSVKEAALNAGVNRATLYRIRRENPEKSIQQCIKMIGTHGGQRKKRTPIREKADEIGISYGTLKGRIQRFGWDKAVAMGNTKLRRGMKKGAHYKHTPIEQIILPENDEDLPLKNLIKSLKAMGFNDKQIIEESKKRLVLL